MKKLKKACFYDACKKKNDYIYKPEVDVDATACSEHRSWCSCKLNALANVLLHVEHVNSRTISWHVCTCFCNPSPLVNVALHWLHLCLHDLSCRWCFLYVTQSFPHVLHCECVVSRCLVSNFVEVNVAAHSLHFLIQLFLCFVKLNLLKKWIPQWLRWLLSMLIVEREAEKEY